MQSAGRRRWFFAAGGVLAGALAAGRVAAQGAVQPSRVALLLVGTHATESLTVDVFRDTMARLGHVEGRNLVLDLREADGRFERYPALLAEALGEKPKVIVVRGSEAVHAAMRATRSVPIVAISVGDPVEQGIAQSLARPGKNVTGNALVQEVSDQKTFEILRELVPGATRIGRLANLSHPLSPRTRERTDAAASRLGLQVTTADAGTPEAIPRALATLAGGEVDALVVANAALFNASRRRIVDFAARERLPAIYPNHDYVLEGGLASYAYDRRRLVVNAAALTDRILRGANPGELPFEQPTDFELVINARTAREQGIAISPTIAARGPRYVE